MGECGKEDSFAVLDAFFDLGGNFIDTANAYQCEESEEWIGEWMEKKGNRDQMVIATKYTTGYRGHARDAEPLQSNFVGNSFKSMHISVNRSLKKMRTDYIDLLYVHWWDFTTSVEEVMHGLNALITAGKVLYLGVSDTPAWVVVKANEYARSHGLRPFSVYQGKWNASYRDMEREIIPMVCPSAVPFLTRNSILINPTVSRSRHGTRTLGSFGPGQIQDKGSPQQRPRRLCPRIKVQRARRRHLRCTREGR